jgi:tetratricopeptide (TPR) repeat protein
MEVDMKTNGPAGLVVILMIILFPLSLSAAVVDWVSGEVAYSHYKAEWNDVEVGMNLGAGDIIKTGIDSEAILVEDGGEIHILENTEFTMSERVEDQQKKSTLMLFLGRMKFKLGRGAAKEPEIQTQTVNLAIRGTEFEVGSGFDGSTIVLLTDGSVAVKGKTQELILVEGEGTEVEFGDEPKQKFKVMERVIDWDEWFELSEEAIKGNEATLLKRMLERFEDINRQIEEYENIRSGALGEKESLIAKRDESVDDGDMDEASEYAKKANEKGKIAFHSMINIRFLALSSIGLYDMAERIYTGIEEPSKDIMDLFEDIEKVYRSIEQRYIREGDRERLEEKATQRKGCLTLF